MNIAEWLYRQARVGGARPALYRGEELVADYRGFASQAGALAGWLAGQGVRPGDRVALFMANMPDYLTVMYGIWSAGAAAVPVNARLTGEEAAWILEDAGARIVFATGPEADRLAESRSAARIVRIGGKDHASACAFPGMAAPVRRAPGDLAWLFYTSGTTGRPKGVTITHRMLISMALCYFADVDEVHPDDATIYAAPASHAAGIYNFMHVLRGARHVFPLSGGFDADEVLDLAARMGPAHLFAAPTMVKRLVRAARARGSDGAGLRTVVYAGGPMYLADIIEAVEQMGPRFVQIYGQGECPMGITSLPRADVADRSHPRWRERLASVGRAQSAVEVGVVDEEGRFLPPGREGEVVVAGDTVMPGYWNRPDATAETLVEGWLHTGDIGRLDDDGYLTLVDRAKDLIISGGSNIYPREVEEVLLTHPSVREVAVVGRPDPEWGETVVAFVVPEDEGAGIDAGALDAHCVAHIARYKRPREYRTIAELPKNSYGKVLKRALREMLAAGGRIG